MVDSRWFDWAIKKSPHGSYEAVAKQIVNSKGNPIDKGGLSRRVRGIYAWTDDEIEQFAMAVGEDLVECRKRAGMWVGEKVGKR